MTRRDFILGGCIIAVALWVAHLSSELSGTDRRLDRTMEKLMDLRTNLWDKHHLGPEDPDPLDLFRKDER
jgi:hypothetical protein